MDNDGLLALGTLVRHYRERRGWTQEDLAERAGFGFSVDTVSNVERGRNRPRRHTLQELITALQLSDRERDEAMRCWYQSAPSRDDASRQLSGSGYQTRPARGSERILVARSDELNRIATALNAAEGLSGRLVLVSGEAGIGKTRLVEEVEQRLADGFAVAIGRCYEPQAPIPFHPFSESLASLTDGLEIADIPELEKRSPYLSRLLSDANEQSNAEDSSGPDAQQQMVRAVIDLVQYLAASHPVALVLEDIHWADEASLEILLHLSRHIRGHRVFLLATYRDVGLPHRHPLRRVLSELVREQLTDRIQLHPLTREESAMLAQNLAGERISERLADLIHARAEGNPFLIQQVVLGLRDKARAEHTTLGALDAVDQVPDSVQLMVQRRLDRLSESARSVLYGGSVLGQSFGFEELRSMAELGEEELEDALDEGVEAGLIRDMGGETYSFDHVLTQGAIYRELSSRRKMRLHRAAGAALEQLPERKRAGRAAEIAWHFLAGDNPQRGVQWVLRAGDAAAAVFAKGDAATQYGRAADLAQELGDTQVEAEAQRRLGEVLHRAGRSAEAIEPLEQAAALFEHLGDRDAYLRMVARTGEAFHFGGRAAEGIDRVLPVIAALEEDSSGDSSLPGAAELYAALCQLYLAVGRWQDGLEAADTAISLADDTGNHRAAATAEVSRGLALGIAGRVAEQRLAFARAAEIARPMGDQWLLALAVYHQGVSHLTSDDFEQGEQHIRRAIDIAERAGLVAWTTFARQSLASMLVDQGRWPEARSEAEKAQDENESLGRRAGASFPLITLGRIQLLQGEREAGLRFVQSALALATQNNYLLGIVKAHQVLAWDEVRNGQPKQAIARLAPFMEGSQALVEPRDAAVYARALYEAGDEESAAGVLSGARQRVAATSSRVQIPGLLLESARLARRQEHGRDAIRDLWEGLAIARELGLPYDEALLLEEYGTVLAATGESEQARLRLDEALEILERLHAPADVQRVHETLASLTARVNTFSGRKKPVR